MRLLRILPERWQNLVREASSFAVIGVMNTAIDLIILNALLWIGPLKAKVVSAVVATTFSYLANRYWTFAKRERTSVGREYVLFFALNLIGTAIQLSVIGAAKYGMGFSESGGVSDRVALNVANLLGIGIALVFRFWSYRTFVFPAPTEQVPKPAVPDVVAPAQAIRGDATVDEFALLTVDLDLDEPSELRS